MADRSNNLGDVLTETLAALPEASEYLAGARPRSGRRPAPRNPPAAVARWLATSPTLLLFRTNEWAKRTSQHLAARGHETILFERYLLLEAPWLLIAGLVATLGLGTELIAVHWERLEPEEKNHHPREAQR